jgi:bacterioferritin (cytochrome b1)
MNDNPVVNRILAREYRSFNQYLHEAWTWAPAKRKHIQDFLQRIVIEEQEICQKLAHYIRHHKGIPDTGDYPEWFSETHYLALDHLLSRMVAYQKWMLGEFERDMAHLKTDEARFLLAPILLSKRTHLKTLEGLSEEFGGTKSVATVR